MDMMEARRRIIAMAMGKLPSFMNHLESGTLVVTENDVDLNGAVDIQLTNIATPKGVLLYSNGFNCFDAKTDKPFIGAYAALWIQPADNSQIEDVNGWKVSSINGVYMLNWGNNSGQANANPRYSYGDSSRGVYLYNPTLKKVRFRGFYPAQTNGYDFQYNMEYHWLVWD